MASVFSQSYDEIEYLIIDGVSTDGTLEHINRHLDEIDYFVSEPDQGLYYAMNKGLAVAKGEFVYFLNSDDYFCDADVVADVVETICNHPEIDLVYGDVLMSNGDHLDRRPQVPVLNRESLCRKGFCHQALFARRKLLLDMGGFSLKYRIVSDGDLLARVLATGASSMHIGRNIAVFAMGGISSTVNWRKEKRQSLRANFTAWERFLWRKLPGIFGRK